MTALNLGSLFSIMATEIRLDANYPGIRFKFLGYLGKSRINMVVDVSFGGSIVPDVLVSGFPHTSGFTQL